MTGRESRHWASKAQEVRTYEPKAITVALAICILNGLAMEAEVRGRAERESQTIAPTFVLTHLDVTDNALEIRYQITNDSDQEVWLCKNLGSVFRYFSSEVSMTDDGEALLVRRRLDVPISGFGEQIFGSFIRIPRAGTLEETMLFPLPVRPHRVTLPARSRDEAIKYVKQLRIEVGYYSGDLPKMISRMLEDAASDPQRKHVDDMGYPIDAVGWSGNSISFNRLNELVPDRNEQVVIPWTDQSLKGEQVLQAIIENLHVPYMEKPGFVKSPLGSLEDCTKAEVYYRPSMFDYLFPHPIQKRVLDYDEEGYLQAQKKVLVEDPILISALIDEIGKAKDWNSPSSCIFTERSTMVYVVCYRGQERLTSFTVYDGMTIVTDERRCCRYPAELASIRAITSAVKWVEPFRFRVECAANLSKLWHRLRLYHQAERLHFENSPSGGQVVYPSSERWSDAMSQVFQIAERTVKAYECPDAGEGPCNYAMNPDCEPNSAGDMVLLFEAKTGWNQHGGPELFTFDNHDPKGGCVLLNDGTVKFVRTEEELHALRWK